MPRREEALASMRDALQIQDPEWDIVPGSAEWKILEAIAQQVENITFNSVLNDYHFDVEKKSGLELDVFMTLMGFSRIKAKRATGEVTFSRGTAAAQDYVIQLGSQVFVPATQFSPNLFFQTTTSSFLATGETSVSVPVQAVVAGSVGNVAAGAITGLATSVGGVTAVFNSQPISGGIDAETDLDLKERWRRTSFRNMSGTEDMFLGLAFNESAFVTRATLAGPIERYVEQVQLSAPEDLTIATPWATTVVGDLIAADTAITVSNGNAFSAAPFWAAFYTSGEFQEIIYVTDKPTTNTLTVIRQGSYDPVNNTPIRQVFPSSVPDAFYTFTPGGEVVGIDIGTSTQQVGVRGLDYEIVTDRSIPASIDAADADAVFPFLYVTTAGATTFGLDQVVEMEHEYTPLSSRNDPDNGVADKVDLFVDGNDELTVTEQFPMQQTDNVFDVDEILEDFLRDDGVNTPFAGNFYSQLSKSPVKTLPDSIAVAATSTTPATTYYKDEDYWLVLDKTTLEGSPRGSNGIEWRASDTAPNDVFAATIQVTANGKLDGWFSYVYTYEIDGLETLASDPESPSAQNDASHRKNALTVPVSGGTGTVIWRKVYRSFSSVSQVVAEAGPFYLLTVIKNNTTTAFLDNKLDDALRDISPPKAPPPVGTNISVTYTYNRLIERLDAQVDLVRLIGMDTLVHEADDIQLKFNLAIVLISGMNITDVKSDINTNIFSWINRKSFRNNIQISDLIDTVSNAVGVDNVRLVAASEARNDVQKLTIIPPAVPLDTRDKFTITIDGVVSGVVQYNEASKDLREILEAMPNLNEGNTYATILNGAVVSTSATSITVDDNPSLHEDNDTAEPELETYWIQIDDEIMYVSAVTDAGATLTLTVRRGQLGTTAATHADNADVHVLGDVAVSRTGAGTTGDPYIYTLYFLENLYTGVNDWGTRELDLVTLTNATEQSRLTLSATKKVNGVGSGIQQIALNGTTVIATYTDDFYLSSDELPSLFGIDILVRAQNSF